MYYAIFLANKTAFYSNLVGNMTLKKMYIYGYGMATILQNIFLYPNVICTISLQTQKRYLQKGVSCILYRAKITQIKHGNERKLFVNTIDLYALCENCQKHLLIVSSILVFTKNNECHTMIILQTPFQTTIKINIFLSDLLT